MNDIVKGEVGMVVAQIKMPALPRVLLIEDNSDHVELLVRQLNHFWVDLRVAQSCYEAWAILQREKIDLVILDYSLPDLDGLSFLKKLRFHAWRRPVLMMTAHLERTLGEEAGRQGANYFVHKSTADRFIKKVSDIVARELQLAPRQKFPTLLNLPETCSDLRPALH